MEEQKKGVAMRITVLNGSPKGVISVTYQFYKYITKKFSKIEFIDFKIAQQIKTIETNKEKFDEIMDSVKKSDAILWITPVYHFTIPGQLKRFIELIFEGNYTNVFEGKYATLITSSIHFYDNMAENYIQGVSEDMGMKYCKGYLAEMQDLTKKDKREILISFFADFLRRTEKRISSSRLFAPINKSNWKFNPEIFEKTEKSNKYKILAIADIEDVNSNLSKMLKVYQSFISNEMEVINLNDLKIKSGCLGCCICSGNNQCSITDDLTEIYQKKIKEADAIIYVSEIRDRYLSAKFKMFFDRSFVNGHAPLYAGKQIQYILSGPISQESNLREEIKARCEVGCINLVDIISDEISDDKKLTQMIKDATENMIYSIENRKVMQTGFYETAGHKIFRDFVFKSRILFSADHRFYRKIKYYDFPNRNIIKIFFINLLYYILKNKNIRKRLNKMIKLGMIMKSEKIVKNVK